MVSALTPSPSLNADVTYAAAAPAAAARRLAPFVRIIASGCM